MPRRTALLEDHQSAPITDAETGEVVPCPHCSGELYAITLTLLIPGKYRMSVFCKDCGRNVSKRGPE